MRPPPPVPGRVALRPPAYHRPDARVAELADAAGLNPAAERRAGSTPAPGTGRRRACRSGAGALPIRGVGSVPVPAAEEANRSAPRPAKARIDRSCAESADSPSPTRRRSAPTGVTRVLLAGLAERGQDATGWAWRVADGPIEVRKASRPLAGVLHDVDVPRRRAAGDRPRPRVHEGHPRRRGQQPPHPLGPRRRRAQRAPGQRRRAVRPLRPAALDAAHHASTPRPS